MENSSRNPILMFFRNFVVGRFGIPRYSDNEEYPLEPKEIEILKQRFDRVYLHYPEFEFFKLMDKFIWVDITNAGPSY